MSISYTSGNAEQYGTEVYITLANHHEASSYQFTVTFNGCKNAAFPKGNPYVVTLGPLEADTQLLCQQEQEGAWAYKWRLQSKALYVEQSEDPDAFVDDGFPADMSSVGESQSRFSCASSVDKWVRSTQLGSPGTAKLFGEISPNDIVQGRLGDCWLMSSFACLAEYPEVVRSLFATQGISENGSYDIFIYSIEAKDWVTVTIDDRLPCDINGFGVPKPIFAKDSGDEIWPMLLEKAFAKFCGSYGMLSGGYPGWAFQALTGEPCIKRYEKFQPGKWGAFTLDEDCQLKLGPKVPRGGYWTIERRPFQRMSNNKLWNRVRRHTQNHNLACCMISDSSGEAEGAKASGLYTNHLYSFLEAELVCLDDGSEARLVKLRNPWGNSNEWNGEWSDSSSTWETNPAAAEMLRYEAKADGSFWMSWSDWTTYFNDAQFCTKDMSKLTAKLDDPFKEAIKNCFIKCDDDGSGKLDPSEFAMVLAEIGMQDPEEILGHVDKDGDGKVNYNELVDYVFGEGDEVKDESEADDTQNEVAASSGDEVEDTDVHDDVLHEEFEDCECYFENYDSPIA